MRGVLENKIASLSSYLVGLVLVLAPIWAFTSVWVSSATGHYTAIRLIIECLLVLVVLAAASLLILDKKLAARLARQKWLWPLVAFVVLEIIWGLVSYASSNVSLKALCYAWVLDLRYLLFFVAVYVTVTARSAHFEFFSSDARAPYAKNTAYSASRKENPNCTQTRSSGDGGFLVDNWQKLIFIPAALVAVFAVLQFLVLPYNFLAHFGYNAQTIFPYQTINHNKSYERVMSFTRGSNPLGAYLVVIIPLALVWVRRVKRRLPLALLALASVAALVFSFSRSAWLGLAVSLVLLAVSIAKARARKVLLAAGVGAVVLVAVVTISFWNNAQFQNYVFHTQNNSAIKTTSDEGHISAFKNGWHDFSSDPLGNGPGSSGPASIYNRDAPSRNTENYYLQIGEEDGWFGLALLLAVFVLVAVELARSKSKLALALLASFIGLAVTNFLLPAWTDVTLAYIFWGLAAIALAGIETSSKLVSK